MANTDIVSIRLVDHKGDTGHVVYHIPTGQAIADILFQAQAFMGVLDDITGAVIQEANVTLGLALPVGLDVTPVASQDIEKGANIGFDVADTPYRTTIRVPAINETLLTGEVMNIASGLGLTFVNEVITGRTPVLPSNRFGADIVGALDALVTFRKR